MICLFITIASRSKTNARSVLFFPRSRNNIVEQNITKYFFCLVQKYLAVTRLGKIHYYIRSRRNKIVNEHHFFVLSLVAESKWYCRTKYRRVFEFLFSR